MLVGGEWAFHTPFLCGMVLGSILSPLLFTIFMKPLGEVICQFGFWYHQYAGDIHLYPSTLDQPAKAAEVLSQWRECLNPTKTQKLRVFGVPRSGDVPTLTLNRVALPHSRMMHNLGIFPGLPAPVWWAYGTCFQKGLCPASPDMLVAPFPRLGVGGFRKSFMP